MKRKFAVVLAIALVLICLLAPAVMCEDDGMVLALVTDNEKVYVGDSIDVDVVITGNPGIWSPTVCIGYDMSAFDYVGVKNGTVYADEELTEVNPEKNPIILSYTANKLEDNNQNGVLATLTFKIKENAPLGNNKIEITSVDICNAAEEIVQTTIEDVSVSIYARFDAVSMEDAKAVYNRGIQRLSVTGLPTVASVTYKYNDEQIDGVVRAGVYAVEAIITASYYDSVTLHATLTVEPAELILTELNLDTGIYRLQGLYTGDAVTLDLSRIRLNRTDTGDWRAEKLYLTGADSENYVLQKKYCRVSFAEDRAASIKIESRLADDDAYLPTTAYWFPIGKEMSITATAVSGSRFAYWTNIAGEVVCTEETYNFIVSTDIELVAHYVQSGTPALIVAGYAKGREKQQVEIPIMLFGNTGIFGIDIAVSYSKDDLILSEVRNGCIFADSELYKPIVDHSPLILSFTNRELENVNKDGLLVTLIFTICEGADIAELPLKLSYDFGNIMNVQEQNVAFWLKDGEVEVIDVLPGDVNRDGKITKLDLLRLQKYLAGWDVEIDLLAADTNGDGKVSKGDLLRLQKHLAGWDVQLGK